MVRHDVFVVTTPIGEDERFAVLHPERMRVAPCPLPQSLVEWHRVFHDFVRSVPALSEDELRAQLAGKHQSPHRGEPRKLMKPFVKAMS
jgi:hypothetical protein